MPDTTDDVVDISDTSPTPGVNLMDAAVASMMTQQLTQSGIIAQNNFITVQKVVDYDYLENKRMVTLDEALGAREVASKVTPGGPSPA